MTMRLLSTPLRGFQRVLPTVRQARGAVEMMDPDDYHKQLRNRNEKARKVVKRILSKKPWRADVSSKYQDAETLKDREKKTDDLLYRMKEGAQGVDRQADMEEAERLTMPSLLQTSRTLAQQEGTYPWAIVAYDTKECMQSGRSWITYEELRNGVALSKDSTLKPGCLVEIRYGSGKELRGYALFNGASSDPHSTALYPIVWTRDEIKIDDLFWNNRLRFAMQLRAEMLDAKSTSAFRLINSTTDRCPGLHVDVVGKAAYVKCYKEGMTVMSSLIPFLLEDLQLKDVRVEDPSNNRTAWLEGEPGPKEYLENGVRLVAVDGGRMPIGGPNWLVHRPSRGLLKSMAKGKRVLDLYCGSGGFAAHALAGGAEYVECVDRSRTLIEQARKNLALNDPENKGNWAAFPALAEGLSWEKRTGTFDIVVVDPPFDMVKVRIGQTPDTSVLQPLVEAWMRGIKAVKEGGFVLLTAYVRGLKQPAFHFTVQKAARLSGRRVQILRGLTAGTDFSEVLADCTGDTRYKGYLVRVLDPPAEQQRLPPKKHRHSSASAPARSA
ncbi:Ribosomal RNA large subunit methyltransferase I [Diplonema papillatum]|nr:Ribosomal RNA large subunit methyltransferase I [Diplonema papillatum]KAJ9460921.1 Ribosomal RNA large subunit methyltransferase I [Diplonema papillatum]